MVTRFTSDSFPNTHIEFTAEGVRMTVTLNIEPKMRHFLSPNNIRKGEKFYVYSISHLLHDVSPQTLKETYNVLMQRAMINCRNAKIAILENEKKCISERKLLY